MKKFIFSIFFILTTIITYAQVSFAGYLVDAKNKKVKEVAVKLFEGNKLISTKKWSNKFKYNLSLEKYYTLELIKKGYISKRIAISTFEGDKGADPFVFVMEMVKTEDSIKDVDSDYPTALIEYKKNEGSFNFNIQYQQNVKKEEIEALKKNKKETKISPKTTSF